MNICCVITILNILRSYLNYSVFRREIRILYKIIFMNSAFQTTYEVFFNVYSIMGQYFWSMSWLARFKSALIMCLDITAMLNCCKHFLTLSILYLSPHGPITYQSEDHLNSPENWSLSFQIAILFSQQP